MASTCGENTLNGLGFELVQVRENTLFISAEFTAIFDCFVIKMARKASGANMDYGIITTVFSDEYAVLNTAVFCDEDLGYSSSASYDPRNLQFTQDSIKDSFSKAHTGIKLEDTVADIKGGRLDPSSLGPLKVHEGDDGRLWCENNRRLWVARQAGLPAVDVKMKSNDFISRRLGEETRDKLSNPNFLPKVRAPRP